jgi:excisionase family DNA binding protein
VHVEGTRRDDVSETKELMTPSEVGKALRVDSKTVTRWAERGLIRSIKTPGGHVRLYAADVEAIVNGETDEDNDAPASEYWNDKN